MSAAEQLVGLLLDDGWKVIQRLTQTSSTGGHFSVPYLVHDSDGKVHFLKAFDFSQAFKSGCDTIRELQSMTALYDHERSILDHFKTKRLSHVVTALKHGYVRVPGMSTVKGTVYYLIFELADRDVRTQVDIDKRLDCLWCLRVLDDVTLGLWQAHRQAVAHQDMKPSNVLIYNNRASRVADFGRASRRGMPVWVDGLQVPGDVTYAPPELRYSWLHPDFVVRRCWACRSGEWAISTRQGVGGSPRLPARWPWAVRTIGGGCWTVPRDRPARQQHLRNRTRRAAMVASALGTMCWMNGSRWTCGLASRETASSCGTLMTA
jgi:serine/threonine protein kinase